MKAQMPPLPIPALSQTIDQYLERIKPLVSPEVYHAAEQTARQFETGSGQRLHRLLENWDANLDGSWLKPFWDEGYLIGRLPLNGNVNYILTLDTDDLPRPDSFHALCAELVATLTEIYCQIVDGTLPLTYAGDSPLCMSQYPYVLKSCRIPLEGRDELFVGEKSRCCAHIVILHRENVYSLQVTDESGNIYSLPQLAESILEIVSRTDTPTLNIGAMTEAPRDEAARLRQRLIDFDNQNRENLRQIETALFALCVDEPQDVRSKGEVVFDTLYGPSKNRYFDKCVQLIVGTDYSVGFNFEHSGFDGAVSVDLVRRVFEHRKAGHAPTCGESTGCLISRLDWVTDEGIRDTVAEMQDQSMARGKGLHIWAKRFHDLGSNGIKALKSSPDAFFHLALQLAWYRLHGRLDSTYEAVSMQHFYQGRTEGARPATADVLQFVTACAQNKPPMELAELARKAFKTHSAMLAQCRAGQAPERHLLGLQAMLATEKEPLAAAEDLFSSQGYQILKHDTLSTSGLAAECVDIFGFAPTARNGFAIGYGLCPEDIRLCISCFEEDKDTLIPLTTAFEKALLDLRDILA